MMTDVATAEKTIMNTLHSFGVELVPFSLVTSRILAEDIYADRDFPPFDRVAMDGIAIDCDQFQKGKKSFKVESIGSAGAPQKVLQDPTNCIEIMTGAPLPKGTNAVVRYEDLLEEGKHFSINSEVIKHQNIHRQGSDLKKGSIVLHKNKKLEATDINVLASVGKTQILCYKLPKIAMISSGNELVEVQDIPLDHQIRKSNVYMIQSCLQQMGLDAELFHFRDEYTDIKKALQRIENEFDILLLSGGVSKGKFDFIPSVLADIGYQKLFHRVAQRPGKPFWFGLKDTTAVFAFPGNPVSTLTCFHRYFVPWISACLKQERRSWQACLSDDFSFHRPLTYFAQVQLQFDASGRLMATIRKGNGSGDMVNPTLCDGFIELPADQNEFLAGTCYSFFPFNPIL